MTYRRLLAVCGLFLLAGLAGAPGGVAQSGEQGAGKPGDDTVVITGERMAEAIRNFVGEVAVAGRSQDQMARWDRTICPGMIGLRASYTQLVLDRIAQRAFDVGLNVGKPGCSANILIVVATDPDSVARTMFNNHKRQLGYYYETNRKTLGRSAMNAFVESDAPVRWWHVNATRSAEGREADSSGVAQAAGLSIDMPSIAVRNASLIKRSTRQDFDRAFVIVDGRRLEGVDLTAMADYLAMALLAQLDPDADISGFNSILNLFEPKVEGASGPVSMTDWDIAYLRGLYGAMREAPSSTWQQQDIARSMDKELATPE